jgi:two-component system chemotaxis response regulator CheY
MPGMDGLQFLERQRDENLAPGVPTFVITTESSTELVLRAIAVGARGYICKPFTSDQIRSHIVPALLLSLG